MNQRLVWISALLPEHQAQLKDQLSSKLVSPEVAAELRSYLDDCFWRLLTTLELVPEGEGRVLGWNSNFTNRCRRGK